MFIIIHTYILYIYIIKNLMDMFSDDMTQETCQKPIGPVKSD